ncbi:MAG: glucokinase [Ignavibacteriae bacterium HGW-Ignavibacteriae-3]|nr:MAG: glucokinase [Ignavibacteriae bacterium HGW-Ignavibacteriae-3]
MMKTKIAIGIDVGGTNTVFGFVDQEGNCIFESSIPTHAGQNALQLFERLFLNINHDFSKFSGTYELVGIGIGAPNANYYKGTVELPPNLNWGVVNVLEIVKKYSALPAAITNDANAAAIGEMIFGAAVGMKDFIVITLGTGLGSGIVVNSQLVYGADGFAGEIGHTIVDPEGRACGCGRKGCLETYASASGIRRTVYMMMGSTNIPSELRNISFNQLTSKDIADAAIRGDQLALDAFDYTAKILGLKLADAVAHLSPEAIILFGGLALAGDLIFAPTKRYMEEYMLNIFKNKVELLPSALPGAHAAVLGASALIWNELKRK